ncbi:MAG: hypothetical protein AAGF74_03500 [Pseudomonadota bacterium]
MTKAARLGTFFIAFVLCALFFGGLLLVAERPSMRWGLRTTEPIYLHEGNVDVVIGGSSRARRGIFGPYLEEDLREFLPDRDPVVYNLGVAGNGTDAQILAMIELLQYRTVDYVFLQLDMLRRNRPPTHRNLQRLGRTWDIVVAPLQSMTWFEALTHRFQLLYLRFSLAADTCLQLGTECWAPKLKPRPAQTYDLSEPRDLELAELFKKLSQRERRRDGAYFLSDDRDWRFDRGPELRTAFYLDLLIDEAAKQGTRVVLMDFPKFEFAQLNDRTIELVEDRFGLDLITFDRAELREMGSRAWGDFGHFNYVGEAIARGKIVNYIRSEHGHGGH